MFYDKANDPMRKQALDILSSKLASTGKFILLEREDLDVLVKEAGSDMNKIGADYIILGSITEFGRKTEGEQKVFTSTKTQTVEAGVSIRLVEASTGLIIYSDEAKGFAETSTKQTMGVGGTAGYDATLSDKAISSALSQLVENIINKCMDKPWKSYILSIDEGNYVISPLLAMDILKAESAYDSENFFDAPLTAFHNFFGADAVVFSVIDAWAKKGMGIQTKIRYVIKSARTNEILFDRSCDLYLDLSIDSDSRGSALSALIDLAASAINTAVTDHIVAARKANYYILRDIPRGKYSPDYMQDKDLYANDKDISTRVR